MNDPLDCDNGSLRDLGAEIILTAIRDAEWLTLTKLSKTQYRHLYGGNGDPVDELAIFAEEGAYAICQEFGLSVSAEAISSKLSNLTIKARKVRLAFPYRSSGRETYQTKMWESA